MAVGEEAVVADAMEAVGQVCSRKRRMNSWASSVMTFDLAVVAIVLPAER